MRPSVKRTIQICGILAIAIMGALCAMQSAQNPLAEAYILGLIAVGVIGIGLSEIKEAGTGPSAIAGGSRGSLRKADPKDLQFDKALSVLVNLIQSHLVANTEYSDSLERAHRDL